MRPPQTLAGSMGIALENARLFGETQRLLKETEQRNSELAFLENRISDAISRTLDLKTLTRIVGDKVRGNLYVRLLDHHAARPEDEIPFTPHMGSRRT